MSSCTHCGGNLTREIVLEQENYCLHHAINCAILDLIEGVVKDVDIMKKLRAASEKGEKYIIGAKGNAD